MMIDYSDRAPVMVLLHGEVCSKREAGKILGCGAGKIGSMIADGRLDAACEGKKVDVRSIARYIAAPAKEDEAARIRRIKMKNNSNYAV